MSRHRFLSGEYFIDGAIGSSFYFTVNQLDRGIFPFLSLDFFLHFILDFLTETFLLNLCSGWSFSFAFSIDVRLSLFLFGHVCLIFYFMYVFFSARFYFTYVMRSHFLRLCLFLSFPIPKIKSYVSL